MSVSALILGLLCLCVGVFPTYGDPGGVLCELGSIPCVCRTPKGIIDLTKISSFYGTPRFTGIKDPSRSVFDYNPCSTFTTSPECTNVYVCQKTTYKNQTFTFGIANKGTEQMRIRDDGLEPYLYYWGNENRETYVHLTCDESVTGEPIIETRGDIDVFLKYVFNITSCHCCPGGCPEPAQLNAKQRRIPRRL